MDFVTRGACSVWSSIRTSETLPLLATSSVNTVFNHLPFVFNRVLSKESFEDYMCYLANRAIASYSFQRLASKNISTLSFIPPTWVKTSALAHSFAEKIANAPGARFLPNAQTACWIPSAFTALQITSDSLYLYSGKKYESLIKLRNLCEQVANKLNALFFAQMALYSFSKMGGIQKGLVGIIFLVPSFLGGVWAKQGTRYSNRDIPRAITCCIATSLILGKYVKNLSWLPQSQAHLVIGALSSWSAFKSATSSVRYFGPFYIPP